MSLTRSRGAPDLVSNIYTQHSEYTEQFLMYDYFTVVKRLVAVIARDSFSNCAYIS